MQLLEGTEEQRAARWMHAAAEAAKEAKCHNAHCGTVIVQDEEVIGRGYNAPPGDREDRRTCNTQTGAGKPNFDKTCCIHAEWRAIMDTLRHNPEKIVGSTLYFCRVDEAGNVKKAGKPFCTVCSRLALDSGIADFVLWHDHGIVSYPTDDYDARSYAYPDELIPPFSQSRPLN